MARDQDATEQRQNADQGQRVADARRDTSGVLEYRLGNRSALEWVIDQYQVSTDKRSGITSDPNRADDEEYIARLIGRVVTVSVETVKLVRALPLVVEETAVQTTDT